MPDREKVIKGLEIHTKPNSRCVGCPYPNNGMCGDQLYMDALALLKAQEPRLVVKEDFENADKYGYLPVYVENKDGDMYWDCITDAALYWDCITDAALGDTVSRFWTMKPTDEQRKAVKLE